MTDAAPHPPTGGRPGLAGRVTGAVLAEIRREIGDSQTGFAERLAVSAKTVQGWETGAKPLIRLPFARLRVLQRTLSALGAPQALMRTWDTALGVDELLDAFDTTDPARHPLAHTVPDRATSDLLAWAITGTTPRELRGTGAVLRIACGERDQAAAALCELADRAPAEHPATAQLRRQTLYLVAGHPGSQPWIADHVARTTRPPASTLTEWSPHWALARSAAVAAAAVGDPGPLDRFITAGGIDGRNAAVNLTYWAYWSGEIRGTWDHDLAMTRSEPAWSGERLLSGLLSSTVHAPYRELSIHTLWALLAARRQLAGDPRWRPAISATVETALSTGTGLSATARRYLDQVYYLVRSE